MSSVITADYISSEN